LIAICFLFVPRIVDESTKKAAAVDPVEPEKVLKAASEVGAYVDCVLTTHHHWYTTSPPSRASSSFGGSLLGYLLVLEQP